MATLICHFHALSNQSPGQPPNLQVEKAVATAITLIGHRARAIWFKTVADEDHTEIANETIVFHYNKDYTLNYISGSDDNGKVMTCKPERDENGTIFGFDYEDNYGYKLYTLIYNPDGTIASMALAQSSAGVGYSTKTYNFVYDNGRLAAYQEVSDYPVTYVFGY